MNIFKNENYRKTSKEHIIQKRNLNLYKDLINNPKTSLACVIENDNNEKKIKRINNHSNLINITHGFFDYNQNGKCKNINTDLMSEPYNVEVFRNKLDPIIEENTETNSDNHNYYGMILTQNQPVPSINTDKREDKEINVVHYTNVSDGGNTLTKDGIKTSRTKCFKLNTKNIIVE